MTGFGGRDARAITAVLPFLKLAMKGYFRSDVRDMDRVPDGGVLMVSNHSGGLTPMDVPILAVALAEEFGADRPLYCLAHDILFTGINGPIMKKFGFVPATREAAHEILTSGALTIVFPGGDFDSFRPSSKANVIDFNGRVGYVRTAIRAKVPIVPVVSIGGQETQFHLTRGETLGAKSPLGKFIRSPYLPITIGFPFGITPVFPPNIPLPSKIVTQVLEPIDIEKEFGTDPDLTVVDAEIRARMQVALDELAKQRRFPVIG
ncbi:MAG: 1-acyl-sn-glycerol-3-phosphate acyltransferase [Aeromicrobium sp.]